MARDLDAFTRRRFVQATAASSVAESSPPRA